MREVTFLQWAPVLSDALSGLSRAGAALVLERRKRMDEQDAENEYHFGAVGLRVS